MKLYVWDKVLCDYTCGIMFAVAEDSESARRILIKADPVVTDDLGKPPTEYDLSEPVYRIVWGGG